VSMARVDLDVDEGFVPDPDDLKMPENPRHRRAVEMVAAATERRLGSDLVVYRDMNWYPTDRANAVAPDIMVLPAGTLRGRAKSYRPTDDGDPLPSVVVEVVSDTDSYSSFMAKLRRYRRLGVPALVIDLEPDSLDVTAHRAGRIAETVVDIPIAELGGIVIGFEGDDLVVRTTDGAFVRSVDELIESVVRRAEEQAARADTEAARADAEAARADALAARLRALGEEP